MPVNYDELTEAIRSVTPNAGPTSESAITGARSGQQTAYGKLAMQRILLGQYMRKKLGDEAFLAAKAGMEPGIGDVMGLGTGMFSLGDAWGKRQTKKAQDNWQAPQVWPE